MLGVLLWGRPHLSDKPPDDAVAAGLPFVIVSILAGVLWLLPSFLTD